MKWWEVFHLLLLQFDYFSDFIFKVFVFFSAEPPAECDSLKLCENTGQFSVVGF